MYVTAGLILTIILLLAERFLMYEKDRRGRADKKLLDWADENHHYSAKHTSLRHELWVAGARQ